MRGSPVWDRNKNSMTRPKKITVLDKDSIEQLVAYLVKYKKVTLTRRDNNSPFVQSEHKKSQIPQIRNQPTN